MEVWRYVKCLELWGWRYWLYCRRHVLYPRTVRLTTCNILLAILAVPENCSVDDMYCTWDCTVNDMYYIKNYTVDDLYCIWDCTVDMYCTWQLYGLHVPTLPDHCTVDDMVCTWELYRWRYGLYLRTVLLAGEELTRINSWLSFCRVSIHCEDKLGWNGSRKTAALRLVHFAIKVCNKSVWRGT